MITKKRKQTIMNNIAKNLIGGSVAGIGLFNPPATTEPKKRKPTIKNLTTVINKGIKIKKKISDLKKQLNECQQKEKHIRKQLEET